MGKAAQVMYYDVIHSLKERDLKELSKWRGREDALDNLQREITQFLVSVMQKPISPEESKEVASLIRMVNNVERFGDAIENIAELIEDLIEQDLYLSERAVTDYEKISDEVSKFLSLVINAMRHEDSEIMPNAQEIEDKINSMEQEMKEGHLVRLERGVCTVEPGLIFEDMLTAFEKMGDFCYNIAQAVAGLK